MSHRFLTLLAAAIAFAATPVAAQTQPTSQAAPKPATTAPKAAPAAKAWAPPKTPWGDPDLQGTWTSDDCIGTPLNRPANLGDRLYYTEQELAQRQSAIESQQQNDLKETVAPDQRIGTGPPAHWGERARRPCKQTSLVVDPPNGVMPDLVPEARTRHVWLNAAGYIANNPKA